MRSNQTCCAPESMRVARWLPPGKRSRALFLERFNADAPGTPPSAPGASTGPIGIVGYRLKGDAGFITN